MASSSETTLNQPTSLLPAPARPVAEHHRPAGHPENEARPVVDYSPSEIVRRHSAAWSGLIVETVQVMRHKPFEYGFRAPCHLLIAAELAERYDGETFVEGLPRSTLRDFTHKLPISISIRADLSPIRHCGSARSSSSRACSFTIAHSGRPLSSSSRWSKTRARCRANTPKRSVSC